METSVITSIMMGLPLFARLLAFLLSAAALGPLGMNWRVRTAASMVLSAMLVFALSPSMELTVGSGWTNLPVVLAREVVLGLALGLSNTMVMEAFRVGGEMLLAGIVTERSLGPDGAVGSPWSHLSVWLGWMLFFVTGSHCQLVDSMVAWCRMYPPGAGGNELATLSAAVQWGGDCLSLAWRWTMPLVLSQWIAQLTLAAISRIAPAWVTGPSLLVWPSVVVLLALAVACVSVGPEQWSGLQTQLTNFPTIETGATGVGE